MCFIGEVVLMTHRGYSLVMKMEQTKLIALKRN